MGDYYVPLWYAKDGTVYDLYGDEYFKQEDPFNRFATNSELTIYMYENGWIKLNSHYFEGQIGVSFDPELGYASGVISSSTPLNYINIGKLYIGYGPDV